MENDMNKIMRQIRAAQRKVEAAQQRRNEISAFAIKAILDELFHVSNYGCKDFRGTHYRKDTGKWIAKIKNKSHTIQIGAYSSQYDAAIARMVSELRIAMGHPVTTIRPVGLERQMLIVTTKARNTLPHLENTGEDR